MFKKTVLVLASVALVAAVGTSAQAGPRGDGEVAFQVRLGGFFPDADSDFWDDPIEGDGVFNAFTLDDSDFNDGVFGFSLVNGFNNYFEAGFNVDFFDAENVSAVRGFVDQDGFPILHDSRLRMVPLSIDLRVLPTGRYGARGGGRFVSRPVFYLGGGIGVTYWEYEEIGDFVDQTTDEIFFDRFIDSDWAFTTHALAGLEFPVAPTWSLFFEGRYQWVDDEVGGDFAGLGDIDLGGAYAFVGASFRF